MKSLVKESKQLFAAFLSVMILFSFMTGGGIITAFADETLPQITNELVLTFDIDTPDVAENNDLTIQDLMPDTITMTVENRECEGTQYDLWLYTEKYIEINGERYAAVGRYIKDFNVMFISPIYAFREYFQDGYDGYYWDWSSKDVSKDAVEYALSRLKSINSCNVVLEYQDGTTITEPVSVRFLNNGMYGVGGRKYFATANAFVATLPDSKNISDASFYQLEKAIRFMNDSDEISNKFYVDVDNAENVEIPLSMMSDGMELTEVLLDKDPIYKTSSAVNHVPYTRTTYHYEDFETADEPTGNENVMNYWYDENSGLYVGSMKVIDNVTATDPRAKSTEAEDGYRYCYTSKDGKTVKGIIDKNALSVYDLLGREETPFIFLNDSVQPNIQKVPVTTVISDEFGSYTEVPVIDEKGDYVYTDVDVNEEYEGIDAFNPSEVEYEYNSYEKAGETKFANEENTRYYHPAYQVASVLYLYESGMEIERSRKQNALKALAPYILENGYMPTRISNVSFAKAIVDNGIFDSYPDGFTDTAVVPQDTQGYFHIEFNDNVNFASALYTAYIRGYGYYANSLADSEMGRLFELGVPSDWWDYDDNVYIYLANYFADFTAIGNYIEGEEVKENYEYKDYFTFMNHCTECRSITWRAFDFKTLEDMVRLIFTNNNSEVSMNDINFDKSYAPDYANIDNYKSDVTFKDYFGVESQKIIGEVVVRDENNSADTSNLVGRKGAEVEESDCLLEETSDTPYTSFNKNNKTISIDTQLLKKYRKGQTYDLNLQFIVNNGENFYNGGDNLHLMNYYSGDSIISGANLEYKWGELILASKPDVVTNIKYDSETRKLTFTKPEDEGLGFDDFGNAQSDGYVYLTEHTVKLYDKTGKLIYETSIAYNGETNQECVIPEGLIDDDHSYSFEVYATNTIGTSEAAKYTKAKIDRPEVTVGKTSDKPSYTEGDEVIFTDTITNTGNVDLTEVVLTENLNGEFVDDSIQGIMVDNTTRKVTINKLGVGEIFMIKYKVTAQEPDVVNGKLTSIAGVTSKEGAEDEITVVLDIASLPDSDTESDTAEDISSDTESDSEISDDNTETDTQSDSEDEIDTSSDSESDTVIDSDTENTESDITSDEDTATDTASDSEDETDITTDSDTETDTSTDEKDSDTESDSETDSEIESDIISESDTDSVTDSDTETDTSTDTATDTDTETDSEGTDSDKPAIEIEKTPDKPRYYRGDIAIYTDTVTNTGNIDLTNVIISENLDGVFIDDGIDGVTIDEGKVIIDIIPAGEEVSVRYKVIVDDPNVDDNKITSTATVTTDEGATNEITIITEVKNPAISVKKTADKPRYFKGDIIIFFDTITNTGDLDLTNVILTENLDGIFIDEGIEGITIDGGKVIIDELPAGESITVKYRVPADGDNVINNTVTSTAKVTTDEGFNGESTLIVDIKNPAIKVEKTPDKPKYTKGDTAIFLDTITNTGDVELTNVILTENLDGTFIDEGIEGITIDGNRVIIDKLSVGESITVKYKVTTNDDNVINGKITSTAKVTSDEGSKDEITLVIDVITPEKETTDKPKETSSSTPKTAENNTPKNESAVPVKTGDSRHVGMYLAIISGAAIILLNALRRRKNNEDES